MDLFFYLSLFAFALFFLKFELSRNKNNQTIRRYTDNGVVYLGNFFTNSIRMALKGQHHIDSVNEKYIKVKRANKKLGFELQFGKPFFLITDLELIKRITIQEFEHFTQTFKMEGHLNNPDDLIGRMFSSFLGPKWKTIRSKVSSTSTSSKLKRIFHIMDSSGKKLVNYFKLEAGDEKIVNIEAGCSKFTLNYIASAAFGCDIKVFENKMPSIFEKMAEKLRLYIWRMKIQVVLVSISPFLPNLIGWSLIDRKAQAFLRSVVVNTIRAREKNEHTKYDDIIQLMLEVRGGPARADMNGNMQITLEDDDIAAHCMSFFVAGFETVTYALQYAAYNLALWPEVQERLYQELREAIEQNDGKLNYEIMNKLEYLQGVISESLRIISVAPATMRVCRKDYKILDTSIVIPKGSNILIPLAPILNDPDYFPNPERFDPERFLAENRSQLHPNAYIPFGQGPRMCVGMKLAISELKSAVAHLVLNFVLEPCEKTQRPMKFDRSSMPSKPAGGIWLKLISRK